MTEEVTFYMDDRGVRVTNTRFITSRNRGKNTYETTYAMANITTVKMNVIPANRIPGIILIIFGILMPVGAYYFTMNILNIVGAIMIVLGILLAILAKPTYAVRVTSAAGETEPLRSKDEKYIKAVVTAINEAIVK